ncbi:copper resistance protein CopC [Amycolatopsis acidiphila]|uniref:Copper resistance protein CopC n=1 Tax=Amycolatopsis acidiphila TaxID=715473 RepID=A0A558AFX8_9PSEU|nr:copper resistance CopC family protein [Amycolatopsis acidiphila]TVT23126.1 copper resistance protein CopC [Amycolatopsis acidiphila]UIJ60187.1 copper resistance protein CopC [Amycolatopsis acidiphila]GHG60879.1 copper resistance protein C [Amycolatopsis acidiphila]
MRKALAVLALTVAAMIGTATPALAHNVLISTDPGKGASLETGPAKITLTFDAPVQGGDINQISVVGPDKSQWAEGAVEINSNVITAAVRPLGPAGTYTVGYRILSADGHPVEGEYTFTLTKAGNGTPATAGAATGAATQSDSGSGGGGVPVWVWILGAVVLLAIGLTLALRTGREKRP